MPFADLPDARVHYTRDGEGHAIVLVHGTGAGSEQWAEAVVALADRRTVVCPDCRGPGAPRTAGRP
jgi:pimeloyl-ACP methyl ester carboxylesterase